MATNFQSPPLCRGPRPGFAYWSTEQLRTLLSSSSLSGSARAVGPRATNYAELQSHVCVFSAIGPPAGLWLDEDLVPLP